MEEQEKEFDIFHKENKYAKSDKIVFQKKFIIRYYAEKFITYFLIMGIICVFAWTSYNYVFRDYVVVDNEMVDFINSKDFSKDDIVVYSETIKYSHEKNESNKFKSFFSEKFKFITKQRSAKQGRIVGIPNTIANINGDKRPLKPNEYAIKCEIGNCIPNVTDIVPYEKIYGMVKEIDK